MEEGSSLCIVTLSSFYNITFTSPDRSSTPLPQIEVNRCAVGLRHQPQPSPFLAPLCPDHPRDRRSGAVGGVAPAVGAGQASLPRRSSAPRRCPSAVPPMKVAAVKFLTAVGALRAEARFPFRCCGAPAPIHLLSSPGGAADAAGLCRLAAGTASAGEAAAPSLCRFST